MIVATVIIAVFVAYILIGFVFGLLFVTRGAGRIDPAARESPIGFRLMILPGSIGLWPVLARRWWCAANTAEKTS